MNSKAKILIVEDESIVALDIQSRLRRLGYLVPAFVATGEDAVAKTAEILPDLILMDIKLRGSMDGIEAARQIKEKHAIPIIYLTAFADETTLQRAKLTEPFGYLLKPFEERELLASIRMALYRSQAEGRIRESEQKFRSVIEQSTDGITLVDYEGRIVEWNPAQEEITGWQREQVMGQAIWDIQRQMQTEETKALFPVQSIKEVTLGLLQGGEIPPRHRFSEMTIQRPDGAVRTLQSRLFIIRRNEQNLIGSVNRDVTQQKQAEAVMQQAQKMESLGVLAGGTAHDFNNLLVMILGQSSLALAKLAPNDPAKAHLEKAIQAAERASDLAQQMLAFSGRGLFESRPVDLNELVRNNQNLYAAAIPRNVRMRLALDDSIPMIEAGPSQMQQVLMNVILNAAEAIGEEPGTIVVSTTVCEVAAEDKPFWQSMGHPLLAGEYVLLAVQDDGCGMDAGTKAKVFEPFFSTKALGRGLGLAAVLGIVRGHQGGICIESELGNGTVCRLLFPVSDAAAVEADEREETAVSLAPTVTTGHVLIIDDEEGVCEAVTDILEMADIPVFTALDGAEGLETYRSHMAEIGLVLLDLSMPGMNGEETYRALRQINPQVQVILSSGYDEQEVFRRFNDLGLGGFLQKPYNLNTLIETVKRHMVS